MSYIEFLRGLSAQTRIGLFLLVIPPIMYFSYKKISDRNFNVGLTIAFIGGLLNSIVIISNDWLMPVYFLNEPFYHDPTVYFDAGIHGANLGFLGDWIPLWFGIASIGDLLIFAGLPILTFSVVKSSFIIADFVVSKVKRGFGNRKV